MKSPALSQDTLIDDFKKITSIQINLKKAIIKFIRTKENSVFEVSDIYDIKLLSSLTLNLIT